MASASLIAITTDEVQRRVSRTSDVQRPTSSQAKRTHRRGLAHSDTHVIQEERPHTSDALEPFEGRCAATGEEGVPPSFPPTGREEASSSPRVRRRARRRVSASSELSSNLSAPHRPHPTSQSRMLIRCCRGGRRRARDTSIFSHYGRGPARVVATQEHQRALVAPRWTSTAARCMVFAGCAEETRACLLLFTRFSRADNARAGRRRPQRRRRDRKRSLARVLPSHPLERAPPTGTSRVISLLGGSSVR